MKDSLQFEEQAKRTLGQGYLVFSKRGYLYTIIQREDPIGLFKEGEYPYNLVRRENTPERRKSLEIDAMLLPTFI